MKRFHFSIASPSTPPFTAGDVAVLFAVTAVLYLGAHLAFHAPAVIRGPEISLDASALPWYALLSVMRMALAYLLSLAFSMFYGYAAAHNRRAEQVLMPLLDVLQSVPILSFLPVILLSLSVILPQAAAAEIAAVALIFTSQAWNLTFSFYQSLKTVPHEYREAAAVFRFSPWLRLRYLELPFAAVGLIWNSIMSWAGGWFFLMAAEMFTVGSRDFRLPGLGSYLQTAASRGDIHAVLLGVTTLIVIVIALDQLLWRPLLAWSERFKLEAVESRQTRRSWFRDLITRSWLVERAVNRFWEPLIARADRRYHDPAAVIAPPLEAGPPASLSWPRRILLAVATIAVAGLVLRAVHMLSTLHAEVWRDILVGLVCTLLRVACALLLALAWTVPLGVLIGTHPRLEKILQPVVQVTASIPATALFPIVLLFLLHLPGGLNLSAILLMLLGAQWYLLFNVIAGAAAIPQDLRDTAALLRLTGRQRWRVLNLPALFPYIVTGAITATGGAWNASIVAEYISFGGRIHDTIGIGAEIARATASGDYARLLATTLSMVLTVVLINRLFWHRLYALAERRYRME